MRFLALFAVVLVAAGFYMHSGGEIRHLDWVGHLPGDVVVRKEAFTIFFPLTSSLLCSAVLSLVLHLFK